MNLGNATEGKDKPNIILGVFQESSKHFSATWLRFFSFLPVIIRCAPSTAN